MAIQLQYRMTVYAGIYSDDTSTTILTPASGSPHSDNFKVSTIQNITGFQPYMNIPRGKRGSLKLPEQKLEVGSYSVTLLDKRTGTDNINRWVTAFFGNTQGKFTLIGKKAYIEESIDNGATWNPFFVGQISDVDLSSATQVSITIKDNVLFLKDNMFRTTPVVDYSIFKALVPVGLTSDILNENNQVIFARPEGLEVSIIGKETGLIESAHLTISSRSRNLAQNLWPLETQFYYGNIRSTDFYYGQGEKFSVRAIVEVSGVPYIFGVIRVFVPTNSNSNNARPPIDVIQLVPLAPWESGAAAMSVLPSGTNITNVRVWLFKYTGVDDKNGVYLVSDWDDVVADALDGKFYEPVSINGVNIGISRKTPYDKSNLTSVMISGSIPKQAFYINKAMSGLDFLEQYAFAPYSVGYTMEPAVVGGVPLCKLKVFSTAQPSVLSGLETLGGSDIITGLPEWNIVQPISAVSMKYYSEYQTRITNNSNDGALGDITPTQQVEDMIVIANSTDNNVVLNTDIVKIDLTANGLRSFLPLRLISTAEIYNQDVQVYIKNKAIEFATNIFNRFKGGVSTVILKTLRNTKTNNLSVGNFVLVELDILPNQATHTRGGTRLMQITNKYSAGINWEFELLDSGVNTVMLAPTVGTPTSPRKSEISVSVTTTQRAFIELQYAATDSGATQPGGDSLLWTYGIRQIINNTTATLQLGGLPEGKLIWVRARSTNPLDSDLKLNSQWVVGGSILLDNISVVSSLTVSNISSRTATISWTNTDSILPIEVWLASPAGVPDTRIITLPSNSTIYYLKGLDRNTSTSHRVGVRYIDPQQGVGQFATANFTATGADIKLDAPAAMTLYTRNS